MLGGTLGLAVAFGTLHLLVATAPASLPRLTQITIDPLVLSFAPIASLVSGLLLGALPILKHAAPHNGQALRGGRTSSESRERHRARDLLVVVQVALALVLLVGAGLMIRTFQTLRTVDPGFTGANRLQLLRLTIPQAQVEDPLRVLRIQQDIRDRMAAIPEVEAVSFTSSAPMEPTFTTDILLAEGQTGAEAQNFPLRRHKAVSPGFFQTVGTPLVAGRDFTWADADDYRLVAVISENLARELWREPAAALGKRIRETPVSPWREVVGVVGDVRDGGVDAAAPPIVYWPVPDEELPPQCGAGSAVGHLRRPQQPNRH